MVVLWVEGCGTGHFLWQQRASGRRKPRPFLSAVTAASHAGAHSWGELILPSKARQLKPAPVHLTFSGARTFLSAWRNWATASGEEGPRSDWQRPTDQAPRPPQGREGASAILNLASPTQRSAAGRRCSALV